MELESVGNDFQWNSSIRDSSSCSAQIKKRAQRENDLRLRNHTCSWVQFELGFVGFAALFVGLLPRFVGSLPKFVGFVTWVSHLGSLWVRQLGLWLISCFVWFLLWSLVCVCAFVVSLVVIDFFFQRGEGFVVDFFQREKRMKKKRLRLFGFLLWNSGV